VLTKTDSIVTSSSLELSAIRDQLRDACLGLPVRVSLDQLGEEALASLYSGASNREVASAMILSIRAHIEQEPALAFVAARLLLTLIYSEVLGESVTFRQADEVYARCFYAYFETGIRAERLAPALQTFDLERLKSYLRPERDLQFQYAGLQTLYDRYLLHENERRFELPQLMWLRVAMGLALNESDRETRTGQFYDLLSQFHFVSSTPTLFNAGTPHSQLSSCFLTTVDDDLGHIFKSIRDNALLSKWSGGLGNDWTRVRGMGAHIKGTNGKSLGTVPFLKVANDAAVAVNQCFAPDTFVFTSDGAKPICKIEAGNMVLGISGTYREVREKFVYDQHEPMVGIDIKHSITPLRVTSGHPLYVIQGVPMEQSCTRTMRQLEKRKFTPAWVDAGDLKAGDYVAQVIPTEIIPVSDFTDDDARLYGILLGDGHIHKSQWGVSGHPERDLHIAFVREYLQRRGIHFWENQRGNTYTQINWSAGNGPNHDVITGRFTPGASFTLPFRADDLYDECHRKHIAQRFSHLPPSQTLALIQGLLETDGGVSRGKEIYFTNTSQPLVEGLRYQLLRLGIPCAGQFRIRKNSHLGRRSDGTQIWFTGETAAYDLRVPAVPEVAALIGCQTLTKRNWLTYKGKIYSRIRSIKEIATVPIVYDLEVEGDESYMTTAGLAHNGGKRAGAVCAYLETWHIDIDEFLDLRKNTGDERRRTHDMHTANWIPDLFMKRVLEAGEWTLFSPDEAPDLHELYGQAFERRYLDYERRADAGEIKLWRRVSAVELWRKMITRLFETGHPWLTWKDPANVRSAQDHAGTIHNSNLCTEILLNTSNDETAVCNLGSVNLAAHIHDGRLDLERLSHTVKVAVRMLDNVIDLNFYPTPEAENANQRHRPIGLGLMGFQDALHQLGISYASEAGVNFADSSMEAVSYYALLASAELAQERGRYASYDGSKWSRGLLPIDTIDLLENERGLPVEMDRSARMDWQPVREAIAQYGMRNSQVLAIAPTATIANIVGVSQSIEPDYKLLHVKSNMSGDFTEINEFLIADLQALGLWDTDMLADLKYFDGSIQSIERIPDDLKQRYKTAFELEPEWLIQAASRRQKWIDMAQSLNLYVHEPNGRKLSDLYLMAWRSGLKTTYYLRTLAATQVEKSTLDVNRYGVQPRWMKNESASSLIQVERGNSEMNGAVCNVDDENCEACQ